jgi:hypothetical protein
VGHLLIDITESCIELGGFSGGSSRDLEESLVGAGEESGRAPDIFTELSTAEEAAVVESTTKPVKAAGPAVRHLLALRWQFISSTAYISLCISDRACG